MYVTHKLIRNLKNYPNIKVGSFDKGNVIAIVDSDEYFEKLDKIVLDKAKFEEIFVSPTMSHPVLYHARLQCVRYTLYNVTDNIVSERALFPNKLLCNSCALLKMINHL